MMRVAKRFGFWWILQHVPSVGPYDTKREAEEDMRGLKKTYKSNKINPMEVEDNMEDYLKLAKLADAYGMWSGDMAKHPDLLKKAGLSQNTLSPLEIHKADQHNQELYEDILGRAEDLGRPTIPVDLKSTEIMGHLVRNVIKWMGGELWEVKEVQMVLKRFHLSLPTKKIILGLRTGTKNVTELPDNISQKLYEIVDQS